MDDDLDRGDGDDALSFATMPHEELKRYLSLAGSHPLIGEYIAHIRSTEGLSTDDWNFGTDDPDEDLKHFCKWLNNKGLNLQDLSTPMSPSNQVSHATYEVEPHDFLASVAKVF